MATARNRAGARVGSVSMASTAWATAVRARSPRNVGPAALNGFEVAKRSCSLARSVSQLPTSSVTAEIGAGEFPVQLARDLVRLDSSNPPGNEQACVQLLADVLRRHGVE